MQRHEVPLRGAESWAVGAGAGRRVRPLRARSSRLAALSRPGTPSGAFENAAASDHETKLCGIDDTGDRAP